MIHYCLIQTLLRIFEVVIDNILFFMKIELKYLLIIGSLKMEEVQKQLVVAILMAICSKLYIIYSSTLINFFNLRVFFDICAFSI